MVAHHLLSEKERRAFEEMLRPDLHEDGAEPEERVVHAGISWPRYLALDQALGDDRPGPRFYYLDGELEIMTTSNEHERLKKWIADLVGDYIFEADIETFPRGQATMRLTLEKAGAEPDESWCLHDEKQFPDLVLEIVLTSGGIRKLEIYRRFAVPEVWFWRRKKLEVHVLRGDRAGYDPATRSALLPGLDLELLQRCVAIPSWRESRRTFRAEIARRD